MSSSIPEEEPPEDLEEKRRRQRRAMLVLLVVTSFESLEVIWTNMTDSQRQLVRMRLWGTTERICRRLARRVGARELAVEARGGRPAYEVSHFLSHWRDVAHDRYERLSYG